MDGGYFAIGSWLIFQFRLIIIAIDEFPFRGMSAAVAFISLLRAVRVRRRLLVLEAGSDDGVCADSIREQSEKQCGNITHHPSPLFNPREGFMAVTR